MTTTMLPFFVYGTLMQGCGNDYYIENYAADVQPASLPGHVMYCGGHFPYVTPASAGHKAAGLGPVHGELVTIKPESYSHVLRQLDRLESYRADNPDASLYVRTACTVIAGGDDERAVQAWVYRGGLIAGDRGNELIPGGDWRAFRAELDRRREARVRAWDLIEKVMGRPDAVPALTWLLAQPDGCFTEAGYLRDGTVYAA